MPVNNEIIRSVTLSHSLLLIVCCQDKHHATIQWMPHTLAGTAHCANKQQKQQKMADQQTSQQQPDAAQERTAGEASTSGGAGPSTTSSSSSKDKPIVVLIIGEFVLKGGSSSSSSVTLAVPARGLLQPLGIRTDSKQPFWTGMAQDNSTHHSQQNKAAEWKACCLAAVVQPCRHGRLRQDHPHPAHQLPHAPAQAAGLHNKPGPCSDPPALWSQHRHPRHGACPC